jgi:hypothetical protein
MTIIGQSQVTSNPSRDDQKVSTWFSWAETWHSELAERHGIDNRPPQDTIPAIKATAERMDRVRETLGYPVLVSSWYRCLRLNRLLGSSDTSQHVQGRAVDFRCPSFGKPEMVWKFLRQMRQQLGIDQLILEFANRPSGGWVHVSFTDQPRYMALIIDETGTRVA